MFALLLVEREEWGWGSKGGRKFEGCDAECMHAFPMIENGNKMHMFIQSVVTHDALSTSIYTGRLAIVFLLLTIYMTSINSQGPIVVSIVNSSLSG